MALDNETLAFMRKYRIAETDVYDAGLMPRSQWQAELKKLGKRFAYSSPCKHGGHRLRNRHGACLVCRPQSMGFEKHHRSRGYVYVAFSEAKRLVKIGGETTGEDRAKTLNRQSYGGASDWRIMHRQLVEEVGRVEAVAQAEVKNFRKHAVSAAG